MEASNILQYVEDYKKIRFDHEEFTKKMAFLLDNLFEQENIEYIKPIEYRTKDIISFEEKLKRKKYTNPLKQITDLSGCRVIIYHPYELKNIVDILYDNFKIDKKNSVDKRQILKKNQFGYRGIHFILSLKKDRLELPEYMKYKGLKFELQILTICEYTWATLQRNIEYKIENLISGELSRRLSRLSALLELADEEFQNIQNKSIIEIIDYDINSITIQLYVKKSEKIVFLQKLFNDNGIHISSINNQIYIDELLDLLKFQKLNKIKDIEKIIDIEIDKKYLLKEFSEISVAYQIDKYSLVLLILYYYSKEIKKEYLKPYNWNDPILTLLDVKKYL